VTSRLGLWLVLVITTAIYAPVFTAPFVYEDANWTADLAPSHRPARFAVPGRGLTQWTYQVQSDVSLRSGTFHGVNVGLHLLAGTALYMVLSALVGGTSAPLAGVAVFLWHPLNSQAVAYVSARADLLVALGVVGAIWGVLHRRTLAGLVAFVSGLSMAVLSKEIGLIAFPVVALAWATSRPRVPWRGLTALAVTAAGVGWWLAWYAQWFTWRALIAYSARMATTSGRLDEAALQATAFWRWVRLFVVPVGFTIDPDPWSVPAVWRLVALGALAVVAGGVGAWWLRCRSWAAFGALVVGVSILPRFLWSTGEGMQEHHAYLPMVGVACLVAVLVHRLGPGALEGAL